jgi:hypothetical protein
MELHSLSVRFYLIRSFGVKSATFIIFIFLMCTSLNSSLIRISTGKRLPMPPSTVKTIDSLSDGASTFTSNSINMGRGNNKELILRHFSFSPYAAANSTFASSGSLSLLQTQNDVLIDIEPELLDGPLNYPNPFNFNDGTYIGYRLSMEMEIQLTIYDRLGSVVFNEVFPAGTEGGKFGYNKLYLNDDAFNGEELSAGVYFYYLSFNDSIIGKSKLAVVPNSDI